MTSARLFRLIAVAGPGLLVMLADTDAGNVITAAQAGARWGYRLLPPLLLLIPVLYLVQELTVRLGIQTGRGFSELIRERFGAGCSWLSALVLIIATLGSLVTEFTGIAGIGELFGLARGLTVPLAAAALLAIVATGSYRRMERTALAVGIFELAFFVVAWAAHPDLHRIARDAVSLPFGDRRFLYTGAAVIGMVFNPWMIFYQQSATAEKRLQPGDLRLARLDTAAGAVITQLLTAAVLVAAAALFARGGIGPGLETVGEISAALSPTLGPQAARIVFGIGVVGASMVAAIVSSLALAWGVGEAAGYRRSLESRPFAASWFYAAYVGCVAAAALFVWVGSNLVQINIAAQVLNVFLLPIVFGLLLALAGTALPRGSRRRWRLMLTIGACVLVAAAGMAGGAAGL